MRVRAEPAFAVAEGADLYLNHAYGVLKQCSLRIRILDSAKMVLSDEIKWRGSHTGLAGKMMWYRPTWRENIWCVLKR